MRTRMYGGVRGRKTKVGGKPTFVFLLLDFVSFLLGCCSMAYWKLCDAIYQLAATVELLVEELSFPL